MGTERLPALLALDDSDKDWRVEIDKALKILLGHTGGGGSNFLASHQEIRLIRANSGTQTSLVFYTGGESGTTYEYEFKLDTDGNLKLFAYGSGSYPIAIQVSAAGVVSIHGQTQPTILTASLTWDPGSIASLGKATTTVTVTGASTSNSAVVITPNGALLDNMFVDGYVSAANTVTVRMTNQDSASANEPSHIYRVVVFQY